jgi:hypothetical protein
MADSENKSKKLVENDPKPQSSPENKNEENDKKVNQNDKPLPLSINNEKDEDTFSKMEKPLPPTELRVDTSNNMFTPQPSQNTGSQKTIHNKPASIASSSVRIQYQQSKLKPNESGKRNELPTDTRPDRKQRPEDLKRARYLTTDEIVTGKEKDEETKTKKNIKKKPPTCWVTVSWILTWWAPPFMLRTFGKPI